VYSTCTIEPEENFEVIENFLKENSDFELVNANKYFPEKYVGENNCMQTYPNVHGFDGAFAVKLKRKIN